MQPGMDALGRELSREVSKWRAKLGARQLACRAGDPGPGGAAPSPDSGSEPGSDPEQGVDLLWPAGTQQDGPGLDRAAIGDLDLERVVRALAVDEGREHLDALRNILYRRAPART